MFEILSRNATDREDMVRACDYLERSAKNGFASAEYRWGRLLWESGVDCAIGLCYIQSAAAKGNADAIDLMASLRDSYNLSGVTAS